MLCKVYNDGSSFIAQPVFKSKKARNIREPIETETDLIFDKLYSNVDNSLSESEISEYLVHELCLHFGSTNSKRLIEDYVVKKLKDIKRNLYARRKRFLRKVNLVNFEKYTPYFVTFTYDDEKQTPESFEKKLRKCLSNLHSRKGWLYALVDELGELGQRLHFHGIIFVPPGEMVGNFAIKKQYSTKKGEWTERNENDFFSKFGNNDFVCLSENRSEFRRRAEYVVKYIGKTGNKVIYCRGMPSELIEDMDEFEFFGEFFDFVLKYICFDDVIYNKDRIARIKLSEDLPDLSEFET